MKGKIVGLLFALPFFGIGVWMCWSIGTTLIAAADMRGWQPVPATLQRAGYERHSGDDSDTYEAYAQYTYVIDGQQYTASRVAIASGADNIGSFQKDLGDHLSGTMARGYTVTVYVDPDDHSQAVIDRSIRWGLIGFKSIFLFAFGGFGLGFIIYLLRARTEKEKNVPEFIERPWLLNDKWQSSQIRSSSKFTMYFSWIFAAVWNLISAPLPFVLYEEVVEKGNKLALLGLLFPVVGVGLLIWAIRRTLEWTRFGAAPVELDPFPGSIGGHVGGTIDINLPFDASAKFSLTLSNIFSYMSGSGDDRSRRERAKWQDSQVAHVSSGPKGSRLTFRFDVPEGLDVSDADKDSDSYHLWRLNVSAALPGADFDRDYEIPVYATSEQSSRLPEFAITKARTEQKSIDTAAIEKLFESKQGVSGRTMLFPMGRNPGFGAGGMLFGGIFATAGWFLTVNEGHWFMGGVFGLVGSLIFLAALYFMLNSLEVTEYAGTIRSVRRILGIKVRERSMRRGDFVRFKKSSTASTQSGSKHVVHYTLSAVARDGQEIVVGEGFKGVGQADAAAAYIGQSFGLRESASVSGSGEPTDDYNLLTAD